MPLILNGDGSIGPLSATEVGYLDGVTSAVQGQINGKLTTPGSWTSWTPSIWQGSTLTASSATGSYTRIGNTIIGWGNFTASSSGTAGQQIRFLFPVTSTNSTQAVGGGHFYNGTVYNLSMLAFGSYGVPETQSAVGGGFGASPNIQFASGNLIRIQFIYEAA